MAKRRFKLPGIQDLSKEQEDARALPKEGQHLVIGGPGTGKSILALLRARRYHEAKDDYVFLVFNKLLYQASKQLFGVQLEAQQWQSWFLNLFYEKTEQVVPRLPAKNKEFEEFDWVKIASIIHDTDITIGGDKPYLIIDEGQDMPPQFYRALTNLGYENIFVVADGNQPITEQNSKIQEIQDELAIDRQDVIELSINYRNSYPIARLAQEFYTGDSPSPPLQLPKHKGKSAKKPILFEYGQGEMVSFENVITRILKMADTNPSKLIGVITPDNKVRSKYFDRLKSMDLPLDNGRPSTVTYQSGSGSELSFDEGGIMVINSMSCKGLEFDTVFLADIHEHKCWPAIEKQKTRLFYVMVARAIDRIIMLKEAGKHCQVEAILPQDADVLERL